MRPASSPQGRTSPRRSRPRASPSTPRRSSSRRSRRAAFRRHVEAAKLPPLTLHGLRHTFATLGLDAGVDTVYVSEILGHSSTAITMLVYQHTREERLNEAVRQVGDAIFGGSR
ncbi:MAG: tyrosine-type recombinase/integrase [Actinomycetota bacterium]